MFGWLGGASVAVWVGRDGVVERLLLSFAMGMGWFLFVWAIGGLLVLGPGYGEADGCA